MSKTPRPHRVREPVQVYLAPDDRDLLDRLALESGLSRAEILRRGIRSYAAAQAGPSPMLRFVEGGAAGRWPADVAGRHDEVLAESYRASRRKSR
jgi:hypothetical protein